MDVLNSWVKKGIEPVYVTFRSPRFRKETISWLRDNGFPNTNKIFFGDEFRFKSDIVCDLGAIGMIDDDPYVVNKCAQRSIYGFGHVLPYTRKSEFTESEYIILWETWAELDNIITRLMEEGYEK